MRKFATLFVLSLVVSGCSASHSLEKESSNLGNIQTYDFGPHIVTKSKEKLPFSMRYRNTSGRELKIESITRSCTCTEIKLSKHKIPVGEEIVIDVVIDLDERSGKQMVNFTLLEEQQDNISFRLTFGVYRQGITQRFRNLGSYKKNRRIDEELVITTYSLEDQGRPKLDHFELSSETLALEKVKEVKKNENSLNVYQTTFKVSGTSGSKTGPSNAVLRYEVESGAKRAPYTAMLAWIVESSFSLSSKSLYYGNILDPAYEGSKRVVVTSTDPALQVTGLEHDEHVRCSLKKTPEGSAVEVEMGDDFPGNLYTGTIHLKTNSSEEPDLSLPVVAMRGKLIQ